MDQKEFEKFLGTSRVCANRHWKELLNKDELRYTHPGGFVPVFVQTSNQLLIGFREFKAIASRKDTTATRKDTTANRELIIYETIAPNGAGGFVKYDPHIIQIDELIIAFPLDRDRFGKKLKF